MKSLKMRTIYILTFVSILSSCTSDNFYDTRRIISTDKDQYKIGDNFEITLTIVPTDNEKKIRIYDNYKNLEISFALVNPSKGILNDDWSLHSGQSLSDSKIIDLKISKQKPFTKTFKGKIIDNKTTLTLSIPELKMTATFDKEKVTDGTYIRVHGFCNPIDPEFGASLEEYFDVKDIRIIGE
ncbi:MAG TPA: hypothetical protein VFU05_14715 [Cyclobacteriaceae bacterium]|nr:hypothetical protein [Cyclobacteriaceae bacterium]